MEKVSLFNSTKIIFLFVLSSNCYSQYDKLTVPKDNLSQSVKYWGGISAKQRMQNDSINASRYEEKSKIFIEIKDRAISSFEQNNFEDCIYLYENSLNYGFYNGNFEYCAGVSYFRLFERTNKEKFKSKSKKLLKLSKKHSYLKAEIFLDENFN